MFSIGRQWLAMTFVVFSLVMLALPAGSQVASVPAEADARIPWWKHAVVYQIYPRSFKDTNGDGIGDLNGVTAKLDYLKSLGVNAIWLNPCYPSPQVDTGYDISDYKSIDPQYGTLADFDRLVSEAGKRDIRVLMDLVLLHTSDRHRWFVQSRSSRTNPKAAWYVWKDGGANGGPPNNWKSFDDKNASAWTYDPIRKQFYYHIFRRSQPGLNWRNPEVRKEMFGVARFWLDRGVAGFRLDAINYLFEDEELRDNPHDSNENQFDAIAFGKYTWNLPEGHGVMRELRSLLDSYPGDRVLIGETDTNSTESLVSMYGKNLDEIQLPMNFGLFWVKLSPKLRQQIGTWDHNAAGGWPLYFFSNHDFPRSYTRLGDGVHNDQIAKLVAALLLTVRGTPIIYYGEELGMSEASEKFIRDGMVPSGKVVQPPWDNRAGARTPMQWDTSANAGFSEARPWLPIPDSYKTHNAASEASDPDSILNVYRQLLALRRSHSELLDGELVFVNENDPSVLSYLRKNPKAGPSVLVALNMTSQAHTVSFDLSAQGLGKARAKTLLSTKKGEATPNLGQIDLPPFGLFIAEVH